MKLAFQLGFVLVVACVVLVDSKPQVKPPAKKATAAKPAAPKPQTAAVPAASQDPSAFLKSPEVTKLMDKIKNGQKTTQADLFSVAYSAMQSGTNSTNSSLIAVSKAFADAKKAMNDAPNKKLTAAQVTTYGNKVVDALADLTGTSNDNRNKIKACVASGAKDNANPDQAGFQAILTKCMESLGDGTKDGQAKVQQAMLGFVPATYRGMFTSVDVQGIASQLTGALKGGSLDANAIKNALGSFKTEDLMGIFGKSFGG